MASFQRILVPTDFGEASDRALQLAVELARDSEVVRLSPAPVLTVRPPPSPSSP